MNVFKKTAYFTIFIIFVFVVGGIGGVVMRDRVMPSLVASFPSLSRMSLFQDLAGKVTVIEKTEQLVVREDDSVDAIVSQPSTAVVNIITSEIKETNDRLFRTGNSHTGVLLTNDGLIATYDTFPEVSSSQGRYVYRVLLFDGSSHEARLVGRDPFTNLVFFKIDGTFPAIAFGNSDDARPGKKLAVIGNSFEEYQNRFSVGVLSQRNKVFNLSGKTVASSEKWEGVLDMDLANAGEYIGGPAVNFRGEMVGMFGQTALDGKASYFLIPSNGIRESMRLAIEGKLDTRPALGVYYVSLTKASAFGNGQLVARDRGALIYTPSEKAGLAVLSNSPAEKAGLRFGDIVIAVDGKEVNLDNSLSVAISRFSKGSKVDLLILRGGAEQVVSVQL